MAGAADHAPLFLKEKSFAHQAEYRLFWFTDGVVPPYLGVKAPDARLRSDAAVSLTAPGLTVRAMSAEEADRMNRLAQVGPPARPSRPCSCGE